MVGAEKATETISLSKCISFSVQFKEAARYKRMRLLRSTAFCSQRRLKFY